jgi:NifU-like protein
VRKIEQTIENEIRPMLKQDNGDIELIDVDGNRVIVSLRGRCAQCSVSQLTLKEVVEAKLREYVSPELDVVEEQA